MSAMTTITAPAVHSGRYSGAAKLRLLPSGEQPRFEHAPAAIHAPAAADAATAGAAERELGPPADGPVLVAGHDATRRDAMIAELEATMPSGTRFVHASAFWEVLVHAGSSRMVIVSGELDEMPTESLMRMLGHRYPTLPVVALDAPSTSTARAHA